jgi:hypothetical protein
LSEAATEADLFTTVDEDGVGESRLFSSPELKKIRGNARIIARG